MEDIVVRYVVDDRQLDEARRKLGLHGAAWDKLTKDVDECNAAGRKAGDALADAGRKGQRAADDSTSVYG